MKFQLIDKAKNAFPVDRLCGVPGVSQSGYFSRCPLARQASQSRSAR